MQTTLKIDDDVLEAAEAIAKKQNRTLDEVMTEIARNGLKNAPLIVVRNGIPVILSKPGNTPVTPEIVNALRDEYP
ncbi:MAG: CopG family transcriptional regulator [Rhizobium sp. 63-7]|nr:MAG: CopG family transcriptional regulator [Rhizobium sp. 63-7]